MKTRTTKDTQASTSNTSEADRPEARRAGFAFCRFTGASTTANERANSPHASFPKFRVAEESRSLAGRNSCATRACLQQLALTTCFAVCFGLAAFTTAAADSLLYARDGSGVRGYKDTPKLPWCEWVVHDPDRPAPRRVDPGPAPAPAPMPADAVALFDGRDLTHWQSNNWRIVEGTLETVSGNLTTKESFGSCQLHIEWLAPANFQGHPFDRGNNGVMLMGLFEIQIFDSFNEKLYPDGQAAAIYGQTPPLVNACRPPGQWQSYDIVFTAPVFADGKLLQPARVTVFHNGVLVQNNEEIHGETGHRILPEYKARTTRGPLVLAGHNCPVRFRNIWLRAL